MNSGFKLYDAFNVQPRLEINIYNYPTFQLDTSTYKRLGQQASPQWVNGQSDAPLHRKKKEGIFSQVGKEFPQLLIQA